jgi:hypothetical protein
MALMAVGVAVALEETILRRLCGLTPAAYKATASFPHVHQAPGVGLE